MPEIGDTLFVVVSWDEDAQEARALSIHVTRVAAEVRADELRREGDQLAFVVGPTPVTLEV